MIHGKHLRLITEHHSGSGQEGGGCLSNHTLPDFTAIVHESVKVPQQNDGVPGGTLSRTSSKDSIKGELLLDARAQAKFRTCPSIQSRREAALLSIEVNPNVQALSQEAISMAKLA